MRKKSLLIITCLLSQQAFADNNGHGLMNLVEEAKKAARETGTLETACIPLVEPTYKQVAYCPWMLTQQVQKDREDGLINRNSVASKCYADSENQNTTRVVDPITGKKQVQRISPEQLETFYKSAKATSLGAPEGKMTSACLGSMKNDNDRIAVLSEYTLLRNRAAYGAQSLVQELYDIEATIPPSYENSGTKASWDSYAYGDEAETLKKLKSGYSSIPGMTDLMKQRNECNSSMDKADTRFKLKELRFKQSKVTLAQISIINKELHDIQSSLITSSNSNIGMSGAYAPPAVIRSPSKAQQTRIEQLKAIKETLLNSKPWLKADAFKSLLSKTNLHRVDNEGKPARDLAGEIAWDFKNGEGKEIELAFHEQAKDRRKIVLEELKNIEHAAGCIEGSNKSCDFQDVMKKLKSTPELSEESNILRMDVKENSKDESYRPDGITQAAIYGMDNAASCRQAFRGIHAENNKIARQAAADLAITAATLGVGAAVAGTLRAGAATGAAITAARASHRLVQIVNTAKKYGVAMRALAASSKAQNLVKALEIGNNMKGLMDAVNECDSKIVPSLEKDAIGSLSCDEFSEKNLEAEHTGCLASVLISAAGFAPDVLPVAIKKIAKLSPGGEKLLKKWTALERLAKNNDKAYNTVKVVEGALLILEEATGPKENLTKLVFSLVEDGANKSIPNIELNTKVLKSIQESQDEKEKIKLAKLLLSVDPSLEGLNEEEKSSVQKLASK
jgi:hypothetical protein